MVHNLVISAILVYISNLKQYNEYTRTKTYSKQITSRLCLIRTYGLGYGMDHMEYQQLI